MALPEEALPVDAFAAEPAPPDLVLLDPPLSALALPDPAPPDPVPPGPPEASERGAGVVAGTFSFEDPEVDSPVESAWAPLSLESPFDDPPRESVR